jgi:hypothetical protein
MKIVFNFLSLLSILGFFRIFIISSSHQKIWSTAANLKSLKFGKFPRIFSSFDADNLSEVLQSNSVTFLLHFSASLRTELEVIRQGLRIPVFRTSSEVCVSSWKGFKKI